MIFGYKPAKSKYSVELSPWLFYEHTRILLQNRATCINIWDKYFDNLPNDSYQIFRLRHEIQMKKFSFAGPI